MIIVLHISPDRRKQPVWFSNRKGNIWAYSVHVADAVYVLIQSKLQCEIATNCHCISYSSLCISPGTHTSKQTPLPSSWELVSVSQSFLFKDSLTTHPNPQYISESGKIKAQTKTHRSGEMSWFEMVFVSVTKHRNISHPHKMWSLNCITTYVNVILNDSFWTNKLWFYTKCFFFSIQCWWSKREINTTVTDTVTTSARTHFFSSYSVLWWDPALNRSRSHWNE